MPFFRLIFFSIQIFHILLIVSLNNFFADGILLLISGIINIFLYSYYLINHYSSRDTIDPISLYLVSSIIRLGIGTIYSGFVVINGFEEILQIGYFSTLSDAFIEGHAIFMIGDLVFIFGYYLFSSKQRSGSSLEKNLNYGHVYKIGLYLSLFIILLRLILIGVSSEQEFGRFLHYIVRFGPPAFLYLMLNSMMKQNINLFISLKGVISLAVFLAMFYVAIRSYMKSDLLLVLMPYIIISLQNYRKIFLTSGFFIKAIRAIPVVLISYFLVVTLTVYSEIRRLEIATNYDLIESIEVTPFLVEAVSASIPGTEKFYQYNKFPDSGAWHFVKRLTVTNLGAWSFKEVNEYGYWDRNFFEDVASSVIPRILWPEKPNFWPGRIFAAKVGHAYDAESATTATALGMAASYYWWGGLPILIIGMFFSGCILSMVFRLIQSSISSNPVSTIIWLILLNTSLFWFESSFYGGAQMFIYLAVAFLPIMFLYQILFIKNRIQY